jgi:hypothetical protein
VCARINVPNVQRRVDHSSTKSQRKA